MIFRVPHGSRPHGHDRRLVMCVNDSSVFLSGFFFGFRVLFFVPVRDRVGTKTEKVGLYQYVTVQDLVCVIGENVSTLIFRFLPFFSFGDYGNIQLSTTNMCCRTNP